MTNTPPNLILYPSLAQPVLTSFPETVTESRWHQPWSEPIRRAPRAADYSAQSWPVFALTTFFFSPLSEPTRRKPGPETQQFLAYSESAQFPETVTEDRWHQPWSEPVRSKLRDAYFEFFINDPQPIFAVPLIQYLALSEPVRLRPRAPYFEFLAQSESAQFPETVTEDRWHQPWSEPVRQKPRAAFFNDHFYGSQSPVITFGYYNWLSEPVRTRWFAAALQPAQPYNETQQFPESVTESRWHQPWSEPVRSKPRAPYFSDLIYGYTQVTTVPSIGYFTPLSEPIRRIPQLDTYPYAAAFGTLNPIIPSFGYFNALSVPTRRIPQLDTYPPFFLQPLPFPNAPGAMSLQVTEQGDSFTNSLIMMYSPTMRATVSIFTPAPSQSAPATGIISPPN